MSSTVSRKAQGRKVLGRERLRTERVDRVASLLMASLIVIGALVVLMLVYWLTQTFSFQSGGIKVDQEMAAGRGDHAAGFERDIEPPGSEEVEDLATPSLEDTLEAITDMATTVAATLESVTTDAVASVVGTGKGDDRPPGPLGEGDDLIPRHERWELKFKAAGIRPYAEQLDFYQIELAAIGGGVSTVDYATSLSAKPQKRSGLADEENKRHRLYFMWRTDGPLRQYDQQLLNQAGIVTQGRQLLKFIPKDLEDRLAQIEMEYARSKGHSSVREIAKTIFESQSVRAGFEFIVIEQLYRNVPK